MAPKLKLTWVAALAAGLVSASPAFAHHLMGGVLPKTAWQGLLSGLGHPIIGLDHFAFIVGVGLMSHLAGRIALLPCLFIVGTVLGCFVHIQAVTVPWVEPAIALTIAIAAADIGLSARPPLGLLAALFVAAGALHGYAYGESIVGAEPAPLAAYIAGFGLIQYVIATGSGAALRAIVEWRYLGEAKALQLAGGGLAILAIVALVNVAMAG